MNRKEYPMYVRRGEYIGAFAGIENGLPVYRFPGGLSHVGSKESELGSDDRAVLLAEIEIDKCPNCGSNHYGIADRGINPNTQNEEEYRACLDCDTEWWEGNSEEDF